MKSLARLVLVASALALPLGGCASIGDALDPTEWFPSGFMDTKKKLPGERKPVFPQGVPGVSQGIPPELVKGNQQAPAYSADPQATSSTQQASAQPEEFRPAPREEKPKRKAQPKSQTAERPPAKTERPPAAAARRAPEAQQQPEQQPQQQPQRQQGGGTQWPDPPPPSRSAQPSGGIQWPDPPPVR